MIETVPVEIRETDGRPRLVGVILQEGRVARQRSEVFAPGSVLWPPDGIEIRTTHLGKAETRAIPVREDGGAIRISVPATPAIVQAVNAGKRAMSVEFHALREERTVAGVREIQRAVVDGAALTTPAKSEYAQTAAELRDKRRRARVWL